MRVSILLMVLFSSIVGCQSSSKTKTDDSAMHWQRTEMYFGQTRRDGSAISEKDWKKFLDETIVPKFPSGLTVLNGDGRWRDLNGVIHVEGSRVLVVLYPLNDDEAQSKLDEIAREYCVKFDQEAVMIGSNRCEPHTAVAHHDRGDPVDR